MCALAAGCCRPACSPATCRVSLRSFASPQVFVGGEVVRPGVIAFRSNMTVMQALVEVGGYKPSGERNVIILRKSGASGVLMRRNLLTDLTEGTTNDMILAPSDVIVLPKTTITSVAEVVDQYVRFNCSHRSRTKQFRICL